MSDCNTGTKRQRVDPQTPDHTSRYRDQTNPQLHSPSLTASQQASETSSKTKASHTPVEKAELLRHLGILVDDAAFNRYPNFKTMVNEIVKPERLSAQKASLAAKELGQQQFQANLEDYGDFEFTFLEEIMPMIIHEEFEPSEESQRDIEAQMRSKLSQVYDSHPPWTLYEMKEWKGQGLKCLRSKSYLKKLGTREGRIRLIRHSQSSDTWALITPAPDRIYLFHQKRFDHTIPEGVIFSDEINSLFDAYCGGLHPPFIFEGKSARGDITKMKNQGRIDSATTLEIERRLYEMAGCNQDFRYREANSDTADSYPDYNTFLFVATISGEMFKIYIAWAEVFLSGRVRWHMNQLEETSLSAPKAREHASRWCHNILEWGLFTRRRQIEKMRYFLYKRQMMADGRKPLTLHEAADKGHFGHAGLEGMERELAEEAAELSVG